MILNSHAFSVSIKNGVQIPYISQAISSVFTHVL
jgi:hypothetical protein